MTSSKASGKTRHDGNMTTLNKTYIHPDFIGSVQKIRKIVLAIAVVSMGGLFVFAASRWTKPISDVIDWCGVVLMAICIIGRTWCTFYIGGRKTHSLVRVGPYSVSRNPLYVFSILGAMGVGAQLGAVVPAIACGIFAWLAFRLVVMQEERVLLDAHGEAYRAYVAQVPRFWPRLSLWQDVEWIEVRPKMVMTNLGDAIFFLLSVPIAELFEHLQGAGIIPVFLRLP
jgi:protein-S-isoprenylcysteine O-methyltransferase Ste14